MADEAGGTAVSKHDWIDRLFLTCTVLIIAGVVLMVIALCVNSLALLVVGAILFAVPTLAHLVAVGSIISTGR
jgi:ATP/ADP translocase